MDLSKLSIGFSNKDLCTRCGTCTATCPTGAISIGQDFFPAINSDLCTECGLCARTCPGAEVSYKKLTDITFGTQVNNDSFDGHSKLTYVGYTADEQIKKGAAGGGVVTGLLWSLLKHKDVDGCLVTRMNPEKPWLGNSFIARTYEELLLSQGSKYSVIPHNAILKVVKNTPGKFAYVGLPCQIHGLRLLLKKEPLLREKIHVIIGLFCGGALECYVVPEMLETRGIAIDDISDFQFRGGDWPGKMRAVLKSGKVVDMHYSDYKDGAYNYFTFLYSPKRCLTCTDGSAHFSDISVGDVWTRDSQGEYLHKAHSRLLARTKVGVEVLLNEIDRGTIIGHDVTNDPSYRTHRAQTKRKRLHAPIRIERWKRKKIRVPIYDRLSPEDVTNRDLIVELLVSIIHALTQHRYIRYPVVKFLLSRYSVPLIKIRRVIKRFRYNQ